MAGKDYRASYEPVYGMVKPDPRYPNGYDLRCLTDSNEILEVVKSIPEKALVGFDTETSGLSPLHHKLVGYSFAWELDRSFYVPMRHLLGKNADLEVAQEALRQISTRMLNIFNAKFDLRFLRHANIDINKVKFIDSMAIVWLMDSNIHSPNLKEYVMRRLL